MSQKQLATKLDAKVKDTLCNARGIKNEIKELEDLRKLRKEEFIPLSDVIAELKASGKL